MELRMSDVREGADELYGEDGDASEKLGLTMTSIGIFYLGMTLPDAYDWSEKFVKRNGHRRSKVKANRK